MTDIITAPAKEPKPKRTIDELAQYAEDHNFTMNAFTFLVAKEGYTEDEFMQWVNAHNCEVIVVVSDDDVTH